MHDLTSYPFQWNHPIFFFARVYMRPSITAVFFSFSFFVFFSSHFSIIANRCSKHYVQLCCQLDRFRFIWILSDLRNLNITLNVSTKKTKNKRQKSMKKKIIINYVQQWNNKWAACVTFVFHPPLFDIFEHPFFLNIFLPFSFSFWWDKWSKLMFPPVGAAGTTNVGVARGRKK